MGKYGFDIGHKRADDLDRVIIQDIELRKDSKILNIGSGNINQSIRMKNAGGIITSIDIFDYSKAYKDYDIDFHKADALDFITKCIDNEYSHVCVQRMIHYYPYEKMKKLLVELHRITSEGLYISVTGLESAVGDVHMCKGEAAGGRFASLSKKDSETFGIHAPLCPLSKTEFENILTESGWHIKKIWTSSFGNHKAVCVT